MTDHLPECDMEIWMQEQMDDPYAPHWLEPPDDIECQCPKLRACEERVLDAALGKVMAYREDKEQRGSFVHWDDLLVAIRALKEKQ